MPDSKLLGALFLILAAFALVLHSRGKLIPSLDVIVKPGDSGMELGPFVLALVVYLFVLSFMSPSNGMLMTVIVILGALLVNHRRMGDKDLLSTLFDKAK